MPAGAPAAVLLYTLAPGKMVGWTHPPSAAAQAYLDISLPVLPPLLRDGKIAIDEIRAAKPDLILDYGSTTPRYADRAKRLQAETGIPVLLLDGKLERTPEIYQLLGSIVGNEALADALAAAAAELIQTGRQAASQVRAARVYYARSSDGLTTATSSSTLADVIRLVGLANVVDAAGATDGLVKVTFDQIAGWNPDAIIASSPDFAKTSGTPEWARLAAVAQGRVYVAPALPWGWIDEPPSVNRLIGPLWLARALAPGGSSQELRPAVRDFYRRFYRIELNQQQLQELLP